MVSSSNQPAWILDHAMSMAAFQPKNEDILLQKELENGMASDIVDHATNSLTLSPPCMQGSLYLVCDGHGGEAAAEFVALHLPPLLSHLLPLLPLPPLAPLAPPATPSLTLHPTPSFDRSAEKIRQAITEAFVAMERQWNDVGDTSGTTVTCLLITGSLLTLANVGDSEAFIDTGCSILELTKSHNLDRNVNEQARLVKAGCNVARIALRLGGPASPGEMGVGPLRVWNKSRGGLCLSRSIGDYAIGPNVLPMPHIKQVILPHEGCRIFLASDGIWDQYTFSRAARMVRGLDASQAALKITGRNIDPPLKLFVDDASLIIVDVLPASPSDPSLPSSSFPQLAAKAKLHLNLPLAIAQDKEERKKKVQEDQAAHEATASCSCFPCGGEGGRGGQGGGGGEEDEPSSTIVIKIKELHSSSGGKGGGDPDPDPRQGSRPDIGTNWPGYLSCYSDEDTLLTYPDLLAKLVSAAAAGEAYVVDHLSENPSLVVSPSSQSALMSAAMINASSGGGCGGGGSAEASDPSNASQRNVGAAAAVRDQAAFTFRRQVSLEGHHRRNVKASSILRPSASFKDNKRPSILGDLGGITPSPGPSSYLVPLGSGPPSSSPGPCGSSQGQSDIEGLRGHSESLHPVNTVSRISNAFARITGGSNRASISRQSSSSTSRNKLARWSNSYKNSREIKQSIDLTGKGRNVVASPARDFWRADADSHDKIEALHAAVFIPPRSSNSQLAKSSPVNLYGADNSVKSNGGHGSVAVTSDENDRMEQSRSRSMLNSFMSVGAVRTHTQTISSGQLSAPRAAFKFGAPECSSKKPMSGVLSLGPDSGDATPSLEVGDIRAEIKKGGMGGGERSYMTPAMVAGPPAAVIKDLSSSSPEASYSTLQVAPPPKTR